MWYEEIEEMSKTDVNPPFSLCCQGGKVLLPTFNDTPPPLNSLLDYNYPAASKFRDQIRVYNSMFCLTSFDAKIDHSINTGRAPYTFRISGKSYHRIGSLIPNEGTQPKFAHLYFFYTQNEVRNWQTAFIDKDTSDGVDQQIVRGLIQMLDHYSLISKAFRMSRDWCNTHNLLNFHYGCIAIGNQPDSTTPLPWLKSPSCICHIISKTRPTTCTYFAMAGRAMEMLDPSEIDDIISTKLPSLTDDPDGYKVVTDYMLHGPCGKDARYAACTTDGKCSKHFPKSFLPETFLDEERYPHYRRRDNKVTVKKGKFTYNNKYMVPHKRYLMLQYNTYINVEWCNRSKAIKYLFKYLNKGPDRATIVIEENVKNGATLASETIAELSFHLPNQNAITMRDSESLPALLQRECNNVTMFSDWFELSKRDPAARKLTYVEIQKYYVWGVQGFEELMTVNNRTCPTFKEACFAHGLLNDDIEWTKSISEESLWAIGPQLWDMFITMLLLCDVSRPLKLWEETWQILSEDILHKKRKLFNYHELQLTNVQIRNYCLLEIQDLLHIYGRSLKDFKDLPWPDLSLLTNMDNRLIKEALDFDIKKARVSSLLLPTGRTSNSKFVIPVDLMENNTCGIKPNMLLAELLEEEKEASFLVATLGKSFHMRVNDYPANGALDTSKREFNRWVLGASDGNLPAKIKEGEDEPTWIKIPERFLIKE
uniref:Helitron helicase-like domain-containing protein n=1 Tax=Tanacetum cinerariifolium TaxID=118510 RepID=A0A6L2MJK4_TANCI|nr:hypothetical protein [Tanacetum cinerariifolium]